MDPLLEELEEAAHRVQLETEDRLRKKDREPPSSKAHRLNGGTKFLATMLASAAAGGSAGAGSVWVLPDVRDRLEMTRVHETRIDALEKRVERCESSRRER